MLSSPTESWRARGEGRSQPLWTGGGKLRALPPKGKMNLRSVLHRPGKVEVSRQTVIGPVSRKDPSFLE